MITLHELFRHGGDRPVAVSAFGRLHPKPGSAAPDAAQPGPEPDWKLAEAHFRQSQILLMQRPKAPAGSRASHRERRAENAAVGLLLALAPAAGHHCPVCRLREPDP
ncbi:hypothetical protein [Streptomyces sp. NPDC059063]|uniref:hypothetical protein n=1 Tax=unclassified Streptomyces TaxID=2593676 RepID=UPI00367EAB9E